MKAVSSKGEIKKRKRDESQETIMENTKKAKVHAQRKFAQGAAFNSSMITPIKDKGRPPVSVSSSGPLLMGKCPNTEDFLTFLCFRRTSILPAKLDFFKEGFGSEAELAPTQDKALMSVNHKLASEQTLKQSNKRNEKNDDSKKSSVQALRRKYQEQRLAKQKSTDVTTLAKKVKGKNMVRTRSSAVVEETKATVKKLPEKEKKPNLRSGLKKIVPTNSTIKNLTKPKHLRAGLRSGGSVPDTKSKETIVAVAKKTEKESKKVVESKTKPTCKGKKTEGFSDFSSDDNEPLLAVKKPKSANQTGGKNQKKTRSQNNETGDSLHVLQRPTRKTKEAAALYMEMITKKLVSPEKSGDEDMSSMDSFPDLPNAKQTEQRETEIKAKALIPKKPEPKQQLEEKAKKSFANKNDQTAKDVKKSNLKKQSITTSKQDENKLDTFKRIRRGTGKESMTKSNQDEDENKQSSRSSTRNKRKENVPALKKSSGRNIPKEKPKTSTEKPEENERTSKKLKTNEDKKKQKNKTEVNDAAYPGKKLTLENFPKTEKQEVKATRKSDKANEVVKEKGGTTKKRGRKLKPEMETKKLKPGKKSAKQESKMDGVSQNKRPMRKCLTADKIWIDIDGFTSDEEDFLEVSSFTKARAFTKYQKPTEPDKSSKPKISEEKKKTKPENKEEKVAFQMLVKNHEQQSKVEEKNKASDKMEKESFKKNEQNTEKKVSKENTQQKQTGKKYDKKDVKNESRPPRNNRKLKYVQVEEKDEKSESKKRTRPVRQCSTREKRWIETDSDSFSFYATSDEEDNLPIVDFSKVKSSPETKESKEEEKTERKASVQEKQDYFSESDEEPLKKKAHNEENSKLAFKNQREVPALTPIKKPPKETLPRVNKPEQTLLSVGITNEPKSLFGQCVSPPQPVEFPKFLPELSPVSVPNRIEMILHTLKKDKAIDTTPSRSKEVNVTFGSVPYQPIPNSSQMNQIPCTYQVKATFPSQKEPISTHGLDLLSEVALPTTPKENISCQTKRIEKWLKDSIAADQKACFPCFETGDKTSQRILDKPQPEYYLDISSTPPKVGSASSHSDIQKFGQVELIESQKLLKKNLFVAEIKQNPKLEQQQQTTPKKAVTSVQDLLKLQKERREVTKTTDNVPHLKNCKCNNCVVKKGWFKNKPVPKAELQKSSPVEEEIAKPFESLTKALIGEGKISKMAVSVAPMMFHSSSSKDEGDKKAGFQQRKLSFLERMKERERKETTSAAKQSAKAFSPSNERSVYAFEPESEQSGRNASFRSMTRESRTSTTSKSDDEGLRMCEDEICTMSSGTQIRNTIDKSNKSSQSASIAVQVNLDSVEVEPIPELQDGKSIEISTQTEVAEEDSDSPMFYIPLQQATATGTSSSSDQQLIQGVALKLGTEGPMGPNQRVIMKAKLVTKPPDSPSIKAVVMPQPKRIFDQKYNNPPIGTVQPTTRKPPDELIEEKSKCVKSTKDNSDPDSEVSKTTKTTLTGKTLKNKENPSVSKDKQETKEENSPCSSASSSKSKRPSKQKSTESVINPTNSTWLPPAGTPSKLVEAPTFHPTEKDFQDPFEFFDRIRPAAEKFGLCRIIPPSNFKPDCKVSDDMRFTAYNQYVNRMFHRWGPNVKEMMAIKKYLATQSISLKQPPWIGGIEVDLPRLYQSVQNCGGLMKVMEKKKWHQVADMMKIPKAAQDRVTKLDDIYCKYLLPYDTLSHDERQNLFDAVEKDWEERQKAPVESQDSQEDEETEENYIEECEECVVKGRNMALNQFYRIARNTMSMWFRNPEPPSREVETEFWRHVSDRNHHVCVHSGSIDSSGWGYGFPIAKNNSFSKHPWNLKVLTNNSGSVLRYLGPVMGVTVPTLHVGMVFTAFCWYRDPHGLPWIEYLHTGAPKIWYGISDDNSTVFQEVLTKLLPRYIKNKTIWLPSDTAMIPPELLVEHGVSLCHTVQEPGQFILVFPRAFTSSICTGYLVSESVYFAQLSWLATAEQVFKDIQESCEPSMFSLEKLLFSIAGDSRSSVDVLKQVLPMVWHVRQKEIDGRKTLFNLGLKSCERLPAREPGSKKKKGRWAQEDDGDYECEICRTNLYVSLVTNSQEEGVYCLPHAIDLLTQKRHQLKYCKLMYTYTQEEMNEMVEKLELKIENKSQKKLQSKPSTTAK